MQRQYYENHNYNSSYDPNFNRNVVSFFVSLALILGTGFGVYYWQNGQAEEKQDELVAKIDKLEENDTAGNSTISENGEVKSIVSSGGLVNYKGHVGNLELNLPEKYAVIVKVDGSFGNSERTILHISEKLGTGVYRDVLDDYIEIEVTRSTKKLKEEITQYQEDLNKNGYNISKQFDAKIRGYSAHLMTGQSTFAQIRVYFINSGGHSYKFAQISPLGEENKDNEHLLAVLNGMSLEKSGL